MDLATLSRRTCSLPPAAAPSRHTQVPALCRSSLIASTSYSPAQAAAACGHSVQQPESISGRRSLRVRAYGPGPPGTGLSPDLREALDKFISMHPVVLFMKGTKQFPQCGFSNTCVQILNMSQVPYETVNILEDELLRSGMKEYSQWPTFPQVYIAGEFFGGCDIMIESFQKGELPEVLEAAVMSHDTA